MDILLLNTSHYLGQVVGDWKIDEVEETGLSYIFYLRKNNIEKIFFIRKPVIKGNVINCITDVYELRYKDYEDSKLLTLTELSNTNFVINEMKTLIEKYSKFDK